MDGVAHCSRAARRDLGFSLVEALVALAILALISVAYLELSSQSRRIASAADYRTTAALLAASELDGAGIVYPLRPGTEQVNEGEFQIERKITALSDPPGIFALDVVVSWEAGGRKASLALSSHRMDRKQFVGLER